MADPARTVFISYRRDVSRWLARAVFQDLRANDYDVFMDVESIDSGEFERVILTQIDARAHFIVILEPGSLDRIAVPDDWLRREIARAIASGRNIVPMTAGGMRLGRDLDLPADIDRLNGFNALNVPEDYFDDAMEKLRDRFLKRLAPALTPAPAATEEAVSRKIEHALAPPDLAAAGVKLSTPTIDAFLRAQAPRLTAEAFPGGAALSWSTILMASEYTLERAFDEAFISATEVYRGPLREYRDAPMAFVWHYRVRAQTFLGSDGPWSDPVVVRPGKGDALESLGSSRFGGGSSGLEWRRKPEVTRRVEDGAVVIEWAAVPLATEYVVESAARLRLSSEGIENWSEVYRGDQLSFRSVGVMSIVLKSYRVRALNSHGSPIGDWSDPVRPTPS